MKLKKATKRQKRNQKRKKVSDSNFGTMTKCLWFKKNKPKVVTDFELSRRANKNDLDKSAKLVLRMILADQMGDLGRNLFDTIFKFFNEEW